MSRRVVRLEVPVYPDRGWFSVHDADSPANGHGAPLPPVGTLASFGREQVSVGSLQEHVWVSLVIEEWDGPPDTVSTDWEDDAAGVLYLRGHLAVDMGLAGCAARGIRFTGGVGDYRVSVRARNRKEVARLFEELFDRYGDPLNDEFQAAKRDLDGLEQYLLQFWRVSQPG